MSLSRSVTGGGGFLRVALDARMISNSGIGRYIGNLIVHLSKIDRGNTFSVLLNSGEPIPSAATARNLEFHTLKRSIPIYSLKEQVILPSEIKRLEPDIVHYPSFNMPFLNSRPAVVTIHDLVYYLDRRACPHLPAHLYARLMFKMVSRLAKRIITDSEYTKKDIIKHLGVSPGKVSVIHIGVDEAYRRVEDPAVLKRVRVRHGIKGEYILYVGTHHPRKNLVRLIHAFSMLKSKGCQLVITGKMEERRKDVYEAPLSLGIKDRVIFTGIAPEEDLPALYTMASLFVFPSLYEGFGLPPLEAFACGTPVVSSNVTSLPEVVGDAAITIDPLDVDELARSIDKVLSSAELRSELREKGLKRAKLFNWKETAEKTLGVYYDALVN